MNAESYQLLLKCMPFFLGILIFAVGDTICYIKIKSPDTIESYKAKIKRFQMVHIAITLIGTALLLYGIFLIPDLIAVTVFTVAVLLQLLAGFILKGKINSMKSVLAMREIIEHLITIAVKKASEGDDMAFAFLRIARRAKTEQLIMWFGLIIPKSVNKAPDTKAEFLDFLTEKAFKKESINLLAALVDDVKLQKLEGGDCI